jgi:aspartate dehydrogenase
LISSHKVSDPLGVIEAEGACGRFRFESFAHAAPNDPKTSLLTAYSLLQCARLGQGLPVLDLMESAHAH